MSVTTVDNLAQRTDHTTILPTTIPALQDAMVQKQLTALLRIAIVADKEINSNA